MWNHNSLWTTDLFKGNEWYWWIQIEHIWGSPSFFSHDIMVPISIVGERAGRLTLTCGGRSASEAKNRTPPGVCAWVLVPAPSHNIMPLLHITELKWRKLSYNNNYYNASTLTTKDNATPLSPTNTWANSYRTKSKQPQLRVNSTVIFQLLGSSLAMSVSVYYIQKSQYPHPQNLSSSSVITILYCSFIVIVKLTQKFPY